MSGIFKAEGRFGTDGPGKIDELTALLQAEIAAIDRGDLEQVQALYLRKSELLEEIDSASPTIKAQLQAESPPQDLRAKLTSLQALIEKDAALLRGMSEASRGILTEITRISDRHNLSGIYSASGAKPAATVTSTQRVDKSL